MLHNNEIVMKEMERRASTQTPLRAVALKNLSVVPPLRDDAGYANRKTVTGTNCND